MSVESFDPTATPASIDAAVVARLLEASALIGDSAVADFGLSQAERGSMAQVMTAPFDDWLVAAEPLKDDQVESLVRFFTLAEESISGWEAGDKSPVIALVKVLKTRGSYDSALTPWIKANTSNRFLPRGNLMARL